MNNTAEWQVFPRRPGDDDLLGFAAELVPGRPIRIVLGGERWGLEACDVIGRLKPDLDLDFISFRGFAIGDVGIETLVKSAALGSVRYLALERCGITDAGVQDLVQSRAFGRLKNLSLCNRGGIETGPLNIIGDAGAIALATCPNLPVLAEIDLWNTEVGDRGFEAISRLTELETVYAWGTKLTASGAKRIKDRAAENSRVRDAAGLRPFRWTSYHTDFDDRLISWSEEPG